MTYYTPMLVKVEFTTKRDELPGIILKFSWPNPPVPRVMIGLDSLDPTRELLAAVAQGLSAAAEADNYLLIGRQPVRLEVDRKRYVTGITFLKTNKRVDLLRLFRGCVQADDGSDVPQC